MLIIHSLDPMQYNFWFIPICTVADRPKCWITFVRRRTAGDATGLDDKILASLVDERAALLEWIDETWLLNVLRDLGRVEDSWEYFSLVDTEKTQQKGTNMQQRLNHPKCMILSIESSKYGIPSKTEPDFQVGKI